MIFSIEDMSPLEKLSLIDMSYSRIDTYMTCQAKYFYTYILKEDRVFGAAAAMGNVLHGVLEDFVGEELNLLDMLKDLDIQRKKYDPDNAITDELVLAGHKMLAEFVSKHADEEYDIIGKELPFQIVIGSGLISGYIDRVERTKQGIKITDYKSGKWQVAEKDVPTNIQLGIYALAAKALFPADTIRAELYYLRNGKIKGHTFSDADLADAEERVTLKIQEIINCQDFHYTQVNQYVCSYCDFRANGVCGKFNR